MTANDGVEFYVRDIFKDQSGETVVVGIPNNGMPVKVGDRFELRYEIDCDDVLNGVPNPIRRNCISVQLSVQRIDFMRKDVDKLPHGVTGGLYLSGAGLDGVIPTCFLRTAAR